MLLPGFTAGEFRDPLHGTFFFFSVAPNNNFLGFLNLFVSSNFPVSSAAHFRVVGPCFLGHQILGHFGTQVLFESARHMSSTGIEWMSLLFSTSDWSIGKPSAFRVLSFSSFLG